MSINLPPELERSILDKVDSGQYETPADVVEDALHLLEERQKRLDKLRRDVSRGVEQADRGELLDGEKVFDEIEQEIGPVS